MNDVSKEEYTRRMRLKRPALASLGYDLMVMELSEIQEACADVEYFAGATDDDTLLNALDGNEEAEYEFRMAFSDLTAKVDHLLSAITNWEIRDEFDTCTVALIGNKYKVLGFDAVEEDYFSLCSYDGELACTESGKRLMRHTKAEMISIIGQCLGIVISFLDLRQQYDYLKATMDILRDENTSLLQTIKEISAAYEAAAAIAALQSENTALKQRLDKVNDFEKSQCAKLLEKLSRVEAERDAACEDICGRCEYVPCRREACMWWRGAQGEG